MLKCALTPKYMLWNSVSVMYDILQNNLSIYLFLGLHLRTCCYSYLTVKLKKTNWNLLKLKSSASSSPFSPGFSPSQSRELSTECASYQQPKPWTVLFSVAKCSSTPLLRQDVGCILNGWINHCIKKKRGKTIRMAENVSALSGSTAKEMIYS